MNIAPLKRVSISEFRGTEAQDIAVTRGKPRRIWWYVGAGLVLLMAVLAWLARSWIRTEHVVSHSALRTASVAVGHFVRDVAAQGSVVAAVKPTMFAVAPGTVIYAVHAGDKVTTGQLLATLDSPELTSEHKRQVATLDSLNAALGRQEIEIRRQLLASKQRADLAEVAITAAERELKRAQWAWDQRAMSERDYKRAVDEVAVAKLNFEQARDTAALERDSVALDLRTRRLERDRQELVVAADKAKVDQLTVRSPVDGTVGDLAQLDKARVAESAPLLTVVDLSAFEVEFLVAESYASQIKSGMNAEITLGGKTEPGVVTALSPEVRQNQVTGRARFKAGQPDGLRQNERVSVRIVLDERDGVLKFERGSAIDETTRSLYVVRDGRAVRVPVELGAASISEIEVVRGLSAGNVVIISDMSDYHDAPNLVITP